MFLLCAAFWPQLRLVVVMAVGCLGACLSLSPLKAPLPAVCLSLCVSVRPLKLAKIAVLLRVEFTLEPLFAPPDTLPLAPSFLLLALCHQSPTVSKNSSIVIVTDLPDFSGAASLLNTGSCLSCLIYLLCVFVLASSFTVRYRCTVLHDVVCWHVVIFNYLSHC